jgi:hypothetical protein
LPFYTFFNLNTNPMVEIRFVTNFGLKPLGN